MKKSIKEMIWIEMSDGSIFDFELEKRLTPEDFIIFIISLFNGLRLTDKHGNDIELKTKDEKVKMFKLLSNDDLYVTFGKKKLGEIEFNAFWNTYIRRLLEK